MSGCQGTAVLGAVRLLGPFLAVRLCKPAPSASLSTQQSRAVPGTHVSTSPSEDTSPHPGGPGGSAWARGPRGAVRCGQGVGTTQTSPLGSTSPPAAHLDSVSPRHSPGPYLHSACHTPWITLRFLNFNVTILEAVISVSSWV